MSISAPVVHTQATQANAESFSTASITPTAGRRQFFALLSNGYTYSGVPTLSGGGFTWSILINDVIYDTRRMIVFSADGIGSPSSGAWSFSANGSDTITSAVYIAFEIPSDSATSLAQAAVSEVRESATNLHSLSYGSTTDANSLCIALLGCEGGAYDATARASWTDHARQAEGGVQAIELNYYLGSDTAVSGTWNNGTTDIRQFIAGFELEESASGITEQPPSGSIALSSGTPKKVMRLIEKVPAHGT